MKGMLRAASGRVLCLHSAAVQQNLEIQKIQMCRKRSVTDSAAVVVILKGPKKSNKTPVLKGQKYFF
jgi:hypothetical protein